MVDRSAIAPSAHYDCDAQGYVLTFSKSKITAAAHLSSSPGKSALAAMSLISITQDRPGKLGHSFAADELYGRIWVTPAQISAGLIADQEDYKISVWNAYRDANKSITAIAGASTTGTTLTYPTLPIVLPPDGESLHDLAILSDGPAVQDTTYTYTVDSSDYEVAISGQRIVPFPFEPDWSQGLKIAYLFNTVVAQGMTHKEQRRPLHHRMFREMSFKMLFVDYLEATSAQNRLAYGADKVIGVPVFTEPLLPTSTLLGASVVSVSNDLSVLWNLQNLTDFLIFIDDVNGLFEVKEISSIGASSITLTRAIEESMDKNSTAIYPVMLTWLSSLKLTHQSGYEPEVSEYSAEFKELIHGG